MTEETRLKLDKAKQCLDEGENSFHKAAELIVEARKGEFKLTFKEIGNHLGRSETTIRRLLKWHESGAEGPIDWERGSHAKENEAAIEKYLKNVSAEDLKEKLGPMKMVSLVSVAERAIIVGAVVKEPKLAEAIALDVQANEAVAEARTDRVRRNLGGGGTGISDYVKPPDNRRLPFKMEDYATQATNVAQKIYGTWKDDAPQANDTELLFARNIVARIILEFEQILTNALRDAPMFEELDHFDNV